MIAKDKNFAYRHDLNGSECTSNYSNSLDLEWEHEYGSNTDQWYVSPVIIMWIQSNFSSITRLPNKDSEYLSDDGTASNYSVISNKSMKNRENLIRRVDQNLKVTLHTNTNLSVVSNVRSGTSSRRSTPDSLEWDIDHEQLKSEVDSVDFETKELLNEIEQLKNRVLSETGEVVLELEKAEVYESWSNSKNKITLRVNTIKF